MESPTDDTSKVPDPSAAPAPPRPPTLYVDADACPVKDEVYRVAARYSMPVVLVANCPVRVPPGGLVSVVVCSGFGAADDWIAGEVRPGDIAVTADIPLAARCVANGARVLDPKGRLFTENDIGSALAMRHLHQELRQRGETIRGPAPMTRKDRSRFLAMLDEAVNAVRRGRPRRP
jgi:uncharacterized protein YaiI (UPF0178 family)